GQTSCRHSRGQTLYRVTPAHRQIVCITRSLADRTRQVVERLREAPQAGQRVRAVVESVDIVGIFLELRGVALHHRGGRLVVIVEVLGQVTVDDLERGQGRRGAAGVVGGVGWRLPVEAQIDQPSADGPQVPYVDGRAVFRGHGQTRPIGAEGRPSGVE